MLPLCFHRFPVSLVLRAALFGEIRYIDLLICQLPTGQSTKIENPYGRIFFFRMGVSGWANPKTVPGDVIFLRETHGEINGF